MSVVPERASQPFAIRHLTLRNRLVGAPHGRGILGDGLALDEDAAYWGRVAAGGAAMVTVGGTVTAPESAWRRRLVTEAWREEGIPGMALRARAIRAEGAVAACQLVHLGRETTGAEMWFAPVAPSAVRSPREPTRPRVLSDAEIDGVIRGFSLSSVNAAEAGFQVVELHAAHGYLLAQFLSPSTNLRRGAGSIEERSDIIRRISDEIRREVPALVLGIRLSIDGEREGGFTLEGLYEVLTAVSPFVDYVSLTVGVRATYVRDMATTEPPLLGAIERVRPLVDRPLLISQAFRRADSIEAALRAGADLVGIARPLIADPDFPSKVLAGREREVRPCVSCNEDCRAFDPVLLCSVNPDLGPSADGPRPASPLVVSRGGRGAAQRVAIVGAGPAGLECATSMTKDCHVVLFDQRDRIGGQLAIAARAPNRSGWQALLEYYGHAVTVAEHIDVRLGTAVRADLLENFDHVVMALGSEEVLPEVPGIERAVTASDFINQGAASRQGADLVIIDDGFGWWPCASSVETGVASGFAGITVVTPAASFGARLPPEGAVQLLARLRGAPLEIRPMTVLELVEPGSVRVRNTLSGAVAELPAGCVVCVGERRARDWTDLLPGPSAAGVQVVGDALVPRRVQHAIAEGRAAASAASLGHG